MTRARWAIVAALVAIALAVGWAARPAPQTNADRVERITAELRCPVCQGLSVKDSSSETARAMRDRVAERVEQGRTDDEIRDEFRRSYGDWILLSPPVVSASGLVWLAPFAAIALGALLALRRARAPAGEPAATSRDLTPDERRRLEALLAAEDA